MSNEAFWAYLAGLVCVYLVGFLSGRKAKDASPKVEVVSDGPPQRSLAEILRHPPKLALKATGTAKLSAAAVTTPKPTGGRIRRSGARVVVIQAMDVYEAEDEEDVPN